MVGEYIPHPRVPGLDPDTREAFFKDAPILQPDYHDRADANAKGELLLRTISPEAARLAAEQAFDNADLEDSDRR